MTSRLFIALAAAIPAFAPAVASAQYTRYNQTPITISSSGPADVYPASIFVGSDFLPVIRARKIVVTIHGFSHTWPDDVDIVLHNQSYGVKILLMSDAGGSTDAENLTLTFDPDAATTLPDSGPLSSGTYLPTDHEPGENLPAPAPAGPYSGAAAMRGLFPLNDWELYVADDTGGDGGSIAAWSLTIYPENFQRQIFSTFFVSTPATGPAATYPILIDVRGFEGTITSFSPRLFVNHTSPRDLDILLVAPDGTSCMLMSDAGGNTPSHSQIIFVPAPTGSAGTPIPAPLPSFMSAALPTNLAPDDTLPPPAPPGPYGTSLNPFVGIDPNGTWKLFVFDDEAPATGSVSLQMQISGNIFCSADFNRSGNVSTQDIFDFLSAYLSGCP